MRIASVLCSSRALRFVKSEQCTTEIRHSMSMRLQLYVQVTRVIATLQLVYTMYIYRARRAKKPWLQCFSSPPLAHLHSNDLAKTKSISLDL